MREEVWTIVKAEIASVSDTPNPQVIKVVTWSEEFGIIEEIDNTARGVAR